VIARQREPAQQGWDLERTRYPRDRQIRVGRAEPTQNVERAGNQVFSDEGVEARGHDDDPEPLRGQLAIDGLHAEAIPLTSFLPRASPRPASVLRAPACRAGTRCSAWWAAPGSVRARPRANQNHTIRRSSSDYWS